MMNGFYSSTDETRGSGHLVSRGAYPSTLVMEKTMEKEIAVAIVGSFTTVLVAAGGWVFAWLLQRETKARERQRDLIENWQKELLARIALEDVSTEWIAELTHK